MIGMPEFLIDNKFVKFGGIFSACNRHSDRPECAPLLADLFLYSYEMFLQDLVKKKKIKEARSF